MYTTNNNFAQHIILRIVLCHAEYYFARHVILY